MIAVHTSQLLETETAQDVRWRLLRQVQRIHRIVHPHLDRLPSDVRLELLTALLIDTRPLSEDDIRRGRELNRSPI